MADGWRGRLERGVTLALCIGFAWLVLGGPALILRGLVDDSPTFLYAGVTCWAVAGGLILYAGVRERARG